MKKQTYYPGWELLLINEPILSEFIMKKKQGRS